MPSGRLRDRIQFEARAEIDDGAGNPVSGDWISRHDCRAHILFLRGSEAVAAARLEGRQPVSIRIRLCRAAREIGPHWRALDPRTGAIYNVTSAGDMSGNGLFLDILAEQGPAEG